MNMKYPSLCVGLSLSCTAVAEDANDLFALSLEELMNVKLSVASLFEESELDVASSVSLVTQEEWERRGAKRVSDALESVPSVVAYPTWGGAEAIAIRGYATELSVRGIASTLDGVPLNSYTYATSLYDKPIINLDHLDRIEVIRGPGSTLYGTDAFHGVLSYQTRASSSNTHDVKVRLGGPAFASSSLYQSQQIGQTRVHSGIAIQTQGRQDLEYQYTSPYSGESEFGTRDYSYQDLSAYITLDYGDRDSGLWRFNVYADDYTAKGAAGIGRQFFVRLPQGLELESASVPLDRDRSGQSSSFVLGQIDFEKRLSDALDISAQAYHWRSEQEWFFDNSRYPNTVRTRTGFTLPCLTAPSDVNPNPLYCAHELQQGAEESRSGFETNLRSIEDSVNTKWVAGLGIDRQKVLDSTFRRVASDGSIYIDESNPYNGDTRYVRFAFAQGSTELADGQVNLVYGSRLDDYSDVGSHHSPRLGLIFKASPSLTSKILYGHAFRAPTAIERLGNFDAIIANPDIEPEEIDTYEWVNIFHHKNYQTQLSLFGSKWKDGIVLTPVGDGADNQYQNTGKNKSYGVEVQTLKEIGLWNIQLAGSYVRSKNSGSDLEFGAFPRWIMNLQAWYTLPEYRMEIGINERIMLRYRHADTIGNTLAERSRNYYRTDLSIKHQLASTDGQDYSLSFSIRNLFDRDNLIPSLYNAEGGLADLGRQFVAGFNWQF